MSHYRCGPEGYGSPKPRSECRQDKRGRIDPTLWGELRDGYGGVPTGPDRTLRWKQKGHSSKQTEFPVLLGNHIKGIVTNERTRVTFGLRLDDFSLVWSCLTSNIYSFMYVTLMGNKIGIQGTWKNCSKKKEDPLLPLTTSHEPFPNTNRFILQPLGDRQWSSYKKDRTL